MLLELLITMLFRADSLMLDPGYVAKAMLDGENGKAGNDR